MLDVSGRCISKKYGRADGIQLPVLAKAQSISRTSSVALCIAVSQLCSSFLVPFSDIYFRSCPRAGTNFTLKLPTQQVMLLSSLSCDTLRPARQHLPYFLQECFVPSPDLLQENDSLAAKAAKFGVHGNNPSPSRVIVDVKMSIKSLTRYVSTSCCA